MDNAATQYLHDSLIMYAEQSWKGEDEDEWEYLDREASEVWKSGRELYECHLDWQATQVRAFLYTVSKDIQVRRQRTVTRIT